MENVNGIEYTKPKVYLLNETGIGVAEIAARTCYDSFENSENQCVIDFNDSIQRDLKNTIINCNINSVNHIEDSALLDQLAWVHHHHSIIEHTYLQFLIKGTSRGVLQEHARHRLQNISVRSTRYTMSSVINAFVASENATQFADLIMPLDLFVTNDAAYNVVEIGAMWHKLKHQMDILGLEEFLDIALSKENIENYKTVKGTYNLFQALEKGKKKRNVGDAFKHIVTDNWKVDMVVTFNLRSLKNYLDLRDSGAAYFQIRWLAEEMKNVIPKKYLKLIDKNYRN